MHATTGLEKHTKKGKENHQLQDVSEALWLLASPCRTDQILSTFPTVNTILQVGTVTQNEDHDLWDNRLATCLAEACSSNPRQSYMEGRTTNQPPPTFYTRRTHMESSNSKSLLTEENDSCTACRASCGTWVGTGKCIALNCWMPYLIEKVTFVTLVSFLCGSLSLPEMPEPDSPEKHTGFPYEDFSIFLPVI